MRPLLEAGVAACDRGDWSSAVAIAEAAAALDPEEPAALTAASDIWEIWIRGYRETLELLERDERDAAAERYRQIYTEYRARVETLLFDEPREA